ncbi:YadA C-terminal domain-containing protein [Salmonella enterica]|nr:hypothetical protein [Salmonella enterica]EEF5707418.1 hypothetical protein [Salmonella enterica]EIE2766520.1 YadA C-terminal domain-containing protein [Salmonella enterica subsp. enterica serovar Rubislaw]EMA0089008.1 YadA C-terminal domain-containing protein [Salmonella enterica]EMA4931672.1 YadA C-terminal domain-containing protein [Salmonella enterica]
MKVPRAHCKALTLIRTIGQCRPRITPWSGHTIPYAAGNKFSYGIGAGNYQNGNAVAAGVQFRVSQSTNVRLNVSWDSAGNNATGVGIAGGW